MTPCIFHDNVAMRVFNPLSLSLSLLPLTPHPKTRSSTRDSEKRERKEERTIRNREKQRKRVESSSLWTHGPDAYVAMVSRYGVVARRRVGSDKSWVTTL